MTYLAMLKGWRYHLRSKGLRTHRSLAHSIRCEFTTSRTQRNGCSRSRPAKKKTGVAKYVWWLGASALQSWARVASTVKAAKVGHWTVNDAQPGSLTPPRTAPSART